MTAILDSIAKHTTKVFSCFQCTTAVNYPTNTKLKRGVQLLYM